MQVNRNRSAKGTDELRLDIGFDARSLRLEHSLIGVVVHLADCRTGGTPGSPALPVRVARIALPAGTRAREVLIVAEETSTVSEGPVPLAPLQPLRPAASRAEAYCRPEESRWNGRWDQGGWTGDVDPAEAPFPIPAYVAPDPGLYAAAAAEPLARLVATDESGSTPVATVFLRPVRLADGGRLEFTAAFTLVLRLERVDEPDDGESPVVSRAQAMRDVAMTRCTVINPDDVRDHTDRFPVGLLAQVDYLIVTDNNRWNAWTQAPFAEAGGDIVASFERLARWKRQRGLRTRVVTITDIVGGRWGDLRSNSRDLPETIRNFLKMAYAQWGVAWVLIGGDTAIAPVRYAAGGLDGNIARQAVNPPPGNASVWAGDHLRMHVVRPGSLWFPSPFNLLVRADDGRLIPYDAAGTSDAVTPGWFFTAADYAARSPVPTLFVRVNGPAALIDADLQFLYLWNIIPTDLYYSSLVGPHYDQPGKHDWDLLDNGIYGQSAATSELDGINYTPTVSLGRAPVNNATQADTFVDKIIAYERFEHPDGAPLDGGWPDRVVLASENYDGRVPIGSSPEDPPGNYLYHHPAGSPHSIINLVNVIDWRCSLFAFVAEDDVRLIPYRTDAAEAGRGWHFVRDSADLSPSFITVPMGSAHIELPQPTRWLAVYGAPEELAPVAYVFDSVELDMSVVGQEALRVQLGTQIGIVPVRRLYEDIHDMTAEQLAAGPVERITSAGLRDALNSGPHIVSLSGHGNSNGCCKLDHVMAAGLVNGGHTFIAYASSCLTNQFDGSAMGETLVGNPNGGAVAYVGYTRYAWTTDDEDPYRLLFFSEWAALGGNAHLGLLADTRAALLDSTWWANGRWTVLSLNLLGCPEMPLWSRRPLVLRVPEIRLDDRIRLRIDPNPPDPPFRLDPPYRDEWNVARVHVRQGNHEQIFVVQDGSLDALLAGFERGPATVTVVRAGHKPVVREVAIESRFGRWAVAGVALLFLVVVLLAVWRG